jgi:hypothetical protein
VVRKRERRALVLRRCLKLAREPCDAQLRREDGGCLSPKASKGRGAEVCRRAGEGRSREFSPASTREVLPRLGSAWRLAHCERARTQVERWRGRAQGWYAAAVRQSESGGVLGIGRDGGSRQACLRDGTVVTLRAVRPSDVAALRAFLQHLSPESRYLRFHGSVNDFSQAEWEYLASVDGWNHVALIAWIGSSVVGVGRFIRLEHAAEKAEVAFAVADAVQRRGLGRLLLEELVVAALRSGIRTFRAEVLAGNRGIRSLLLRSSLRVLTDGEGAIEVALDPELTLQSRA